MESEKSFEFFDPLLGDPFELPLGQLIAPMVFKARAILRLRSRAELDDIAKDSDWMVYEYFHNKTEIAISLIKSEGRLHLLVRDEMGQEGPTEEAESHYDLLDEFEMTDAEALVAAMDLYFDSDSATVYRAQKHEHLAVLALLEVARFVDIQAHGASAGHLARRHFQRARKSAEAIALRQMDLARDTLQIAEELERDFQQECLDIQARPNARDMASGHLEQQTVEIERLRSDGAQRSQTSSAAAIKWRALKKARVMEWLTERWKRDHMTYSNLDEPGNDYADAVENIAGTPMSGRTLARYLSEIVQKTGLKPSKTRGSVRP